MRAVLKAAALAVVISTSAGANWTSGELNRVDATWHSLTDDQREMIELVARDIYETEHENGRVTYLELGNRKKAALRAEAMDRLGFEPRPLRGVEA